MEPTAAFLPGESKNRPWGCQEVGTTEQLPLSLSLPFVSGKEARRHDYVLRAPSQEGVAATFQPLGRAHAGLRVPDLLGLTVDTPCFRRKHTLVLPAPRLPRPLCPGLLRPRQVKGSPPTNSNEFGPNQTRLGGKKPPRTPERENPKRVTLTTNSTFPGKSHS